MAAPKNWIVVYTVAVYCGALVAYGQAIFSVNVDACTGLISCTGVVFSFVGAFFNFLLLGSLTGVTPALLAGVHLLIMALGWGTYIADLLTQAV